MNKQKTHGTWPKVPGSHILWHKCYMYIVIISWFQGSVEVVSIRRHIVYWYTYIHNDLQTKSVLFSSSGRQIGALIFWIFIEMFVWVVFQQTLAQHPFSAPSVYSNQCFFKLDCTPCLWWYKKVSEVLSFYFCIHGHASWHETEFSLDLKTTWNRCWAAPTQVVFPCTTWSLVRPLSSEGF